jgi:hypothetical protein
VLEFHPTEDLVDERRARARLGALDGWSTSDARSGRRVSDVALSTPRGCFQVYAAETADPVSGSRRYGFPRLSFPARSSA